ncbi:MAG TPA: MFS transporter [Bryobacteraceae bacterium]|nr:MFS transporter [Bryobacteraceae bacterium]
MLKRTFRAFEYREFRLLWFGACTSSIGTWMQKLAQSWLVLQLSNRPFLLGLDTFLGEIPIFLFSLLGGVIADRFDRRKLLVGSQIVQMSCAFLLAALLAAGMREVWPILTLSFVVGLAQAFGGPAYQALIPTLVAPKDLPNAIALNSIQFNLARVIGPVLGGIALARLGASWCFSLNGVSFIAVIIALLLLPGRRFPPASLTMLDSMKEGIGFIRSRPGLEPLILLAFFMTMLGVPLIVYLPVMARDVFHGGPNAYTILLSISGAGAVFGALAVAGSGHVERRGLMALQLLITLGVLIACFGLSRSLPLSCVLLFLGGAALVASFATVTSVVQLIAPDEMRGRVMSVYNVAFRGGMPIGSFLAGPFVETLSAPPVLAANGVLLVVLGLFFLFMHRRIAQL